MKELISHLENLLRENECVIIPHIGGFVSYYAPARRVEGEHLFLPPYRTVGFNSSLTINDGLLIQAYMQEHEASYPTAQQMLERDVEELRLMLENEGKAELIGLGWLTQNFEGQLEFQPQANGIPSSALYGLGSFQMKTLEEIKSERAAQEKKNTLIIPARTEEEKPNTVVIHINRTWLNYAVAVAAAVILFFFLSTPVANTYVEQDSYASLGNVGWLDQIRSKSFATTLLSVPRSPQTPQKKEGKSVEKHKTIHEEKIPLVTPKTTTKKQAEISKPSSTASQPKTVEKKVVAKAAPKAESQPLTKENATAKATYYIIVSSVGNEKDARTIIRQLADKGYKGATMVKGDGRVRVALQSGTDQNALTQKMIELRKNKLFKSAWMLTIRH